MNHGTHGTLNVALAILTLFVFLSVGNGFLRQVNQEYVTETALISEGNASERVKGVFIRNEKLITYDGEGVVSYEVADGGKLGIDSVIANVYSSENQIEIKQRIASLQNELAILERISNRGTIQTAQPSNISDLFAQTYKEFIYEREQEHISDLDARRTEMIVLLSTYQLVTGKDVSYLPKMQKIEAEIEALRQAQEDPLCTIQAEEAAYFVSYADGYEDTFRMDELQSLTTEKLQGVRDNPNNDNGVIGKLIDSYEWVLAAVVDNSKKIYETGNIVTLKFASTSETVSGEIILLNSDEGADRTIIGISCKSMTYDLVQHRTETVEIVCDEYKDLKGLKVSRNALHFKEVAGEDGKTEKVRGVYILNGEQPEFRRVNVIYEGSDYVISALTNNSNYLLLYDAIITKGIDADGQ